MKTLLLLALLAASTLRAQILLPGDANNDGRVNHLDVLAIGLSFGQEGPPREPPFQNIDWSPKPFILWPGALPTTGVNHGFSDTNGNGFVDAADMKAIAVRYDSSHQASQPPPTPYAPPDTFFTSALPRIVLRFDKDTATVKDTLLLSIFYEHPPGLALPDAPLGVAFALEFEQMLVKDSLTQVFFEPTADDLLFAAGATAFSDARAVPPGRVEFAAAGQAAPALSKPRPLGVVRFIVEDVIVRAADTFFTKLTVDASQQLMINVREEVLKFEIATDSIVLFQEKTSVGQPPKPLPLRLYPSPARQWLRLEAPGCPLVRVHVTDAGGRLVERRELNGQNDVEWAPGAWPPGWYLVQAWAADGRTAVRSVFKE